MMLLHRQTMLLRNHPRKPLLKRWLSVQLQSVRPKRTGRSRLPAMLHRLILNTPCQW